MKNIKKNIKSHIDIINKQIDYIEKNIFIFADIMIKKINSGGKILIIGNGGSAADAQHLSTELMGGMSDHERKPIPSISLVTDSSFLTAWANDTDFESIFSRQVQGLGLSGDVLVGISTSGNSENIVSAIKQAKFKELKTIVLTGEGSGKLKNIADVTINVPSKDTQRIQERHIMIGQIICGLIEKDLLK